MENLQVSPLGFGFLRKQEGFRSKPYWDVRQWSTGFGTRASGPNDIVDRAEAERRLSEETGKVSSFLKANVKTPMTQGQHDALVSFGYNLGTDDIGKLLPDINAGDWNKVGSRMLSFNRAGGQVNPGLVNRRKQEAEMLLGRAPQMPIGGQTAPAGGPMPLDIPPQPNKRNSKLAEMLLASAAGAKPKNWGELLNAGGDLALGYSLGDKADTQEQTYRSKLAQALSGATPEALPQTLIGSGDEDLMKAGVQMRVAQAKPQAAQVGRFRPTPEGVLDSTTGQFVPGTERKVGGKAPAGYRLTDDGNLEFIPGGPADPSTNNKQVKYTEGQTKAANFGNMMTKAEEQLAALAPKDPITGAPQVDKMENPKNFLGAIRDGVMPFEALRNLSTPGDTQNYNQVAKQWIRAKLRKESGAAIGADEMEQEFRTYFPQYGDGPEVIKQKALARAEATKGMIAESGSAYDHMMGQPGVAPPEAVAPPAQAPVKPAVPPSPQAVEFLKSQPTPEIVQQFNAKYGPGAAERILNQPQAPQPQGQPDTTGTMMGF